MAVVDHRFRVMASEGRVLVVGGPAPLVSRAVEQLEHLERRWSRFLPDSDITRLNNRPGAPLVVAPDTVTLIERMIDGWRATSGRYDPSVLPALVAAGYGTSLVDPSARTVLPADTSAPSSDLERIRIDRRAGTVCLPPGLTLDPGGIGKGLAADLVVADLFARGAAGALVSIGGDLVVGGRPPDGDGWVVAVEDPFDAQSEIATVALDAGGVCTSSTRSRRWLQHGEETHHVVDPSTGQCAGTDLASVTVFAGAGWVAEVHATAALLAGGAGALAHLEENGLTGIATLATGESRATTGLVLGSPP
jgi:thiamine biosynthesis lipoprotein